MEFKDYRLKSHLNDQFVSKMVKLYGGDYNPGLPEVYLWVKKLKAAKDGQKLKGGKDGQKGCLNDSSKENLQ